MLDRPNRRVPSLALASRKLAELLEGLEGLAFEPFEPFDLDDVLKLLVADLYACLNITRSTGIDVATIVRAGSACDHMTEEYASSTWVNRVRNIGSYHRSYKKRPVLPKVRDIWL